MRVEALDHVNIRCPDVAATSRFFADVLGMRVAASPLIADISENAWICDAEGRPIIHVGSLRLPYPDDDPAAPVSARPPGGGRIHHVALRCSGYAEAVRRLQTMNIAFTAADTPQAGLRQLFIRDPNEIMLELNFFAD